MRAIALTFMALLAATGCSTQCDYAAIAGIYELSVAQDHYVLRLASDGFGSLSRNEVTVGALKWEIEPSSGQVSLNGERAVLDVLRAASGSEPFPSDVAPWKRGYYGVTPRCQFSGVSSRLDLDVDGEKFFVRATG